MEETARPRNLVDIFTAGCRRGLRLSLQSIMPAMILGYVLIEFLQLSGLMDLLSTLFMPLMGLFGLPGEAVTVLAAALFAKASGCAMAVLLHSQGVLTLRQCTIVLPACMLMGTWLGGYARIILVSGAQRRYHGLLLLLPLLEAAVSMWIMRLLTALLGMG